MRNAYLEGTDILGADPSALSQNYLVVHIRDLAGLLKAPLVKSKIGALGGLAGTLVSMSPQTASSVLYTGTVQGQIDKAIADQGLAAYLDAHFTATPPPSGGKPPSEFLQGVLVSVVGGGTVLGLVHLGRALLARRSGK